MNTKTKITITITLFLLILLSVYTSTSQQTKENRSKTFFDIENGRINDFFITDLEGKPLTYNDVKGKHLIINSWASWCPFCIDELPDFKTVQEEFGDQITVLVVNRKESKSIAERFVQNTGINGTLSVLLDPDDSFYRAINGFSMPETIFVSPEGDIINHKKGVMSLEEMRSKIYELLEF